MMMLLTILKSRLISGVPRGASMTGTRPKGSSWTPGRGSRISILTSHQIITWIWYLKAHNNFNLSFIQNSKQTSLTPTDFWTKMSTGLKHNSTFDQPGKPPTIYKLSIQVEIITPWKQIELATPKEGELWVRMPIQLGPPDNKLLTSISMDQISW